MNNYSQNKTYSFEEVFKASMGYFDQDELAATTWINKYALKDLKGNYFELTPDHMHRRMAKEFARIEENYITKSKHNKNNLSDYGRERKQLEEEDIYRLLKDFRYVIPQGSVMAGLGNEHVLASLSNCVVIPELYDSYAGIFKADQQIAQLFKRRCGVGLDLSTLRPANEPVSNAAGTTSGAVSFMQRFSNTTREVAQHGRRGALMMTMDVRHPDIEEFVTIKQNLSKVTGANVSVRLTDEFMTAVLSKKPFNLRWPIEADEPSVHRTINANKLWDTIVSCAHATAEPGLIFWDRQHVYSTSSVYPEFRNVSTNPCSEVAMQGGDSCRLIAINLYSFVKDPFTPQARFEFDHFYQITYEAQRLMDNLVDLEIEAIDKILDKVKNDPEPEELKRTEREIWELLRSFGKKGRRTGLGFTALADTLAALSLSFDSDESLKVIEEIMRNKCAAEFNSSIDLAIERGSFEAFDPEIENSSEFIQMFREEFPEIYARMMIYGRRNISISTVAPTGSLSLLSRTSSGIEPVFKLSYTRRRKVNANDPDARVDFTDDMGDDWQEFEVLHPKLVDWMRISGNKNLNESPYAGSTAEEINWEKRIEIQAVAQKYVTHSISSTINLNKDTSVDRVSDIYMRAWEKGLKGITIYREGARSGVLLSGQEKTDVLAAFSEFNIPERPEKLQADVIRFVNEQDPWVAVVGLLNDRPFEIFTGKVDASFPLPEDIDEGWVVKSKGPDGNNRYDFKYQDKSGNVKVMSGLSGSFDKEFWNYAILISGMLRQGVPLIDVVELVSNLNLRSDMINTWKNGVVRTLRRYIPNGTTGIDRICPVCGDPEGLVYEEGCLTCKSCGHSSCS